MKTLSIQECKKIEKKENQNWPNQRSKLACCIKEFKVYVCGGNGFDSTDFWIYHTDTGEWTKLKCHGDSPRHLQGHTLHPDWKNNIIYVFGGSFCLDTPLWSFDIESREWKSIDSQDGPSARFGHEATFNKDCSSLHVFGGYIGITGSTSEHWIFDVVDKKWSLLPEDRNFPCSRHDFGSVSDDDDWWIFGGSKKLVPLNDLWTFTFCRKQWTQIKLKKSPDPVYGHKLVLIRDTILVIGGKRESTNQWGFNIKKLKWVEIATKENLPNFIDHNVISTICLSDLDKEKSRNSYCYWRNIKISPNTSAESTEEKYDGKIFVNRAFSIESQNYGNNFFNTSKFLVQKPNNANDVILSDFEADDYDIDSDCQQEIETEFSKISMNNLNQILVFGSSSSIKYSPLTVWKVTLSSMG